ncbi:hypothetical protein RRS04_005103 [Klebsiella aerogenes]|nr:hypothetical protein [Klebsiella aerogenes]
MNKSFDRYFNVIKVGDRVMDSESCSIGYISEIKSKNMFSLKELNVNFLHQN